MTRNRGGMQLKEIRSIGYLRRLHDSTPIWAWVEGTKRYIESTAGYLKDRWSSKKSHEQLTSLSAIALVRRR